MYFYTKYERPIHKGEVYDPKDSIVDVGGYVPAEKVIRKMIKAGARLDAFREAGGYEFALGEEIPDDYIDPTRSPGYDIVDAERDARNLRSRLEDAREIAAKIKKSSKAKDGDVPPDGRHEESTPEPEPVKED